MELVDRALKDRKVGPRQHTALKKHAEKHTEPHIQHMIKMMSHLTLRQAHKAAMEAIGR